MASIPNAERSGHGTVEEASTVAAYLSLRLFELGIEHVFNVPGSYCGHGVLFLHSTSRLGTDYVIYRRVTVAAEIAQTAADVPNQIDAALMACMSRRRPVHLEISQDLWDPSCPSPGAPLRAVPQESNPDSLSECLDEVVTVPPVVLKYWKLDPSTANGTIFLTSLLQDDGLAVGAYDGRVTAEDTGIAGSIDPNSGGNDPTMTAVGGVYTTMWNVYLNEELLFTSTSPFMDLNDQAFLNWNFGHLDPTGAQKGGIESLYTAGDLAAVMALNPYLKAFSANGYYDAVTPFFQTILNFENMSLSGLHARGNLTTHNYPSGHMIYLDNESRSAMKADLAAFYKGSGVHPLAGAVLRPSDDARPISHSCYRRRFSRTPY
jgi:hypothetical protein